MRLENKAVIITGVNSGIGCAAAKRFAKEGAKIAGLDVCTEHMEELRELAAAEGTEFLGFNCDVRDASAVRQVLASVHNTFGKIDVVLNVAGVSTSSPLNRIESEEYERIMDINVKGMFNLCQNTAPYMKKRKQGVIINTASITGIYGSGRGCPYAASKAAIIGMTKSLGFELAPWNIRVNAVAPGVVDTEMVASLDEWARKTFAKTIPLRRVGKAEDIVSALLFLASDEADYITSTVLSVDGGYRPSNV